MPSLVLSILVSMHTYECNYACMNVWVHAAGDWSAGNRVWMMGDGGVDGEMGVLSGGGRVGDGVNGNRVEDGGDHCA